MSTDKAGCHGESERPLQKCRHKRAVDDVLTEDGRRTGSLRCLECGAVFPDETAHEQGVPHCPTNDVFRRFNNG